MSRDQLRTWVLATKSPTGNPICTVERKGKDVTSYEGGTKADTVGSEVTLMGLRIDIHRYNDDYICAAEKTV